ncbi:hypothetical protein NpPPO83_00001389 [Neofusicoccum parvum]|uniref:Uncharacterized protein n=1 Tax=Neofusicoccum parvum TaxID=310453 RepID=A0ACB5S7R9_9PEZI|nr:hypothetical protein NpPPO83_00001389 [Neofusicoccum parvum]
MENLDHIWDLVADEALYGYSLNATDMLRKVEDRYRDMGHAYHIQHRVGFGRFDTIPNIAIAHELFYCPEANAPVRDITDEVSRHLNDLRRHFLQGDYVRARAAFNQAMAKYVAIDEKLDKAEAAIQEFADQTNQIRRYYSCRRIWHPEGDDVTQVVQEHGDLDEID